MLAASGRNKARQENHGKEAKQNDKVVHVT